MTMPTPLKRIPYATQEIDNRDIEAVARTLQSDWLTQGPMVDEFERSLAHVVGAQYAVAVNSGTSALHLACLAAGLGFGDQGITSPISFVASANCMIYCAAEPIFADIDPRSYNISPAEIKKRINAKTKVVIPVHFAGQSCDMKQIKEIVSGAETRRGKKIYVIEDASHAFGSCYCGKPVGCGAYSDMTVFSFHPVKHFTTGEGGAIVTNRLELYQRLRLYRSHGIVSDPSQFQNAEMAFQSSQDTAVRRKPNPWYYEQVALGYNFRITDIQCALGLSQMKRWKQFAKRRRLIVERYNRAFRDCPFVQLPFETKKNESNFHLYVLKIDFNALDMARPDFMSRLRKRGISSQVHYIPIHLHPFYRKKFRLTLGDYPIAEAYYEQCLSIPLFSRLSDRDVQRVIDAVRGIVDQQCSAIQHGKQTLSRKRHAT